VNFGAMPNDLFMEQVRRFGRGVAEAAGPPGHAHPGVEMVA
jgi:hypothetical protein